MWKEELLELELRFEMILVQVLDKTRVHQCILLDVDRVHEGNVSVLQRAQYSCDGAIVLPRYNVEAPVLATRLIIQVRVEESHPGAAHLPDEDLDVLLVAVVAEDRDEAAHRRQLAASFPEKLTRPTICLDDHLALLLIGDCRCSWTTFVVLTRRICFNHTTRSKLNFL